MIQEVGSLFMECSDTLPCPQEPASRLNQVEQMHAFPFCCLRSVLILFSCLFLDIPSGLFRSGFRTIILTHLFYASRVLHVTFHLNNIWWRVQMYLFITHFVQSCVIHVTESYCIFEGFIASPFIAILSCSPWQDANILFGFLCFTSNSVLLHAYNKASVFFLI
jgi:hypothetical protein